MSVCFYAPCIHRCLYSYMELDPYAAKKFTPKKYCQNNSGWRPRRKANAGPRRETVRCGATFNPLQFYKINPL